MNFMVGRLQRVFDLTWDFVEALSQDDLKLKLPGLPSNSIGEQLWCVIGGRESYLKAMENDAWSGFSCSLTDATSKSMVLSGIDYSAIRCLAYLQSRT